MLNKIKSYIKESYLEFRRVNWPSRAETLRLTLVVIIISISMAIFLGILDLGFAYLLDKFII